MDISTTDDAVSFDPCHQPSMTENPSNGSGTPIGATGAPGAGGAPGAPGAPGGPMGAPGAPGVGASTGGGAGGPVGSGDYSDSSGGSAGESSSDYVVINGNGQELSAGVLTAGETKDLSDWEYWKSLAGEFGEFQENWELYPEHRVSIRMYDSNGNPFIDLPMFLIDEADKPIWTSRTDNTGTAELWINPETGITEAVRVATILGGEVIVFAINIFENGGTNDLTIVGDAPTANRAEITIAFDATGSMGDELEYIKVEATDIFDRVMEDNPSIDFNFSSVFYRDYGDAYVEVGNPMSSSSTEVIDFINSQSASGGGDFPEAVHRALQMSVVDMEWEAPARARIMFLILDAPPHDDVCTVERMQVLVRESARKGIKIIPITASGIDKNTEYLMRFCSLLTNGTYTYITDHSGIGNDHLEPSVDAIEVEFLNDLMVRLVNEYLE